ncbi:hypothetical protein B7494_g1309 [Chlorociboria aeruginascens]|nr:hypothetical protein B7494_g1309 [Chlorociboria aeruginascens]
MASGECETFPENASLHYVAEGAANIVYRFYVRLGTPPPPNLDGRTPQPSDIDQEIDSCYAPPYLTTFDDKLLRLRKDLPTTVPCKVAQESWSTLIAPLFRDDEIVRQALVDIRPAKVIDRLNEELKGWERPYPLKGSLRSHDLRPTKRNGIYLANDEHGLLITDMTPSNFEFVIELKPKWLLQSPSAPPGSKRCRNCARTARANAQLIAQGDSPIPLWCLLDLVAEDWETLFHQAQNILPSQAHRLADWLYTNELLPRLRLLQQMMDNAGPMNADPNDEDFLVAMTLRDCTLFIKVPEDENRPIVAKLGDLDLKSGLKMQYWRETERALIKEGWYMGLEKSEVKR